MVKRLVVAAAIFAVIGVVAIWRLNMNSGVPPAAAQIAGQAIPVTAGTVAVEDIPVFLHGIGTVQAYNTVAIKSRVDGQIVKVNFKEGQEVKQGDPLFQIDPRPYQSALETGAGGQGEGRSTTGRRPARPRPLPKTARARLADPPELRPAESPGRAVPSRDQGRHGADRKRQAQSRAMPISVRRSMDVWGRAWSILVISCMRVTILRSS